ncbi:MAG: hypothetical protein AAFQ98_04130 [Bacteroidota bacterium]
MSTNFFSGTSMEILVNNQAVDIFRGARVKDAVLQYSLDEYREVIRGRKVVEDEQGIRLGLGGRLSATAHLNIVDR